ncbi:MAG: cellulose biosynthesis protein BcsS [Hyphomicrobiales bacterium]
MVRGVAVAGMALALLAGGNARAGEPLMLLPGQADEAGLRRLVFSGVEASFGNVSFHFGERRAAGGRLDRDGWLIELCGASGAYAYEPGARLPTLVIGDVELSTVSAGFQKIGTRSGGAVFAGPTFERHQLHPDDAGNPVRGAKFGMRVAAEGWMRPLPRLIVAASASASTVHRGWRVEARALWQAGRIGIGPEATAAGNREYTMMRAGLRVDGIRLARSDWSLSGGILLKPDSDEPARGYGTLGWMRRF